MGGRRSGGGSSCRVRVSAGRRVSGDDQVFGGGGISAIGKVDGKVEVVVAAAAVVAVPASRIISSVSLEPALSWLGDRK
jgi:hypothetical protein